MLILIAVKSVKSPFMYGFLSCIGSARLILCPLLLFGDLSLFC
uniref:Uncharacterized protein n=1 Tax=Rhizophora mucronata TaxID=61149 RepID=A0A2P2MXA1_RHIMU